LIKVKNFKSFVFEKTTPLYIFKTENFLDNNLYEKIRFNFPEIPKDYTDYDNLKFGFSNVSDHYKSIIKTNSYLRELHDLVYSKEFFEFFYNSLFTKILLARKDNFLHLFKLLRPAKFIKDQEERINFFKKIFYNKIKIGISFSYIKNGGFIVPHTDGIGKLISLMIYFPDTELLEESELGTNFYNHKAPNYQNKHLKGKNFDEFYKKAELIYKSKFDRNNLYGFIKSNYSWHSVSKINFGNKDYLRKSININFYF